MIADQIRFRSTYPVYPVSAPVVPAWPFFLDGLGERTEKLFVLAQEVTKKLSKVAP